MKRHLAMLALALLGYFSAVAQNRSLTGTVTDAENKGIISATVKVKGKSMTTITDEQGRFALTVPAGKISLEVSSVGFDLKTVDVDGSSENINVSLASNTQQLGEVVVTALGVTKLKRSVSSSVTEIKVDDLTQARTNNVINGLAGKVAGVNIVSTATGPAGSSRVVIRGNTSLTGTNQPLYVVDGVPIDNGNRGSAGEWGGQDAGDGIQSINPDEIETISVLKGGAAAALYGSRASNGVILITTKKGSARKGIGVEFNSNILLETPTSNTDWQYEYGHGVNGNKPATIDGARDINLNSWGGRLDGSSVVQFDGVSRPYVAQKDNLKNFYETGTSFTNTISLNGGSDKGSYFFTASDLNNKSFIPNSSLRRDNLSLNTTFNPIDKLHVNLSVRYIRERVKNRPRLSDSPGNANFSVFLLPTSLDVRTLKTSLTNPDGSELKWQGNDYVTNPYWATERFQQHDERDRFIGSVEAKYDLLKWLYVRGRIGADQFTTTNFAITPYGTKYQTAGQINDLSKRTFNEFNGELLLGVNKNFRNIGIDAFVGGNRMERKEEAAGVSGDNFFGPNFYDPSNLQTSRASYNFSEKRINSVFGSAEVSFKKYLYLTVTGRNDWFSTLSPQNWSIFYPSVGTSFILSDVVTMPSWVNFLKLRGSWAQVGGDTDPYQLALSYRYSSNPYGNNPVAGIAQDRIPNANLKPYTLTTYEAGFETRLAGGRIGVDFTVYNRKTTNDIVSSQLSQTTGFNSIVLNVGAIRNQGVELLLTGSPIKTTSFNWDASFNVGHNKSKVEELYKDLTSIRTASARSFTGFVENIVGKPYGQIVGYKFKRDAKGNILLQDGLPQRGESVAFGSGVAPWTLGLTNNFSYKHFSLNVLVDGKFGGLLYSGTNDFGTYRGVHKNTLVGREGGIIAAGVDGAGNPNATKVDAQPYYQSIGLNITEPFIYKSDFIKLRQVIISYEIPAKIFNKTAVKGLSVSLVGRNLAILKKYVPNIDPESTYNSGNGQGLEWFGAPSSRSMGFNLNVKF